jgi:hypothetical protein
VSQRWSEYAREPRDSYPTPAWVTAALVPHIPDIARRRLWEPACGSGQMLHELQKHCPDVRGTDIDSGVDFRHATNDSGADTIITNPPFGQAQPFIEHALNLTRPHAGMVCMLLRVDYDSAKTRQHLFAQHPAFARKLTLTRRIVWFERPGAAPSFNHAWFIWSWRHSGPPILAYGPDGAVPAEYDANKDFSESIADCYTAIRARKAASGPGWPA